MNDKDRIKIAEDHLQRLLDSSEHDTLTQGLRLLALYVASLKYQHGELDQDRVLSLLRNDFNDNPTGSEIFESGIHEAIAILSMVQGTSGHVAPAGTVLN